MALYVHITDECDADATRLRLESQLRKAKQSIETNQDIAGFSFLSPAVLKKKIGRPFRLIAWHHTVANDDYVFFIGVIQRRRADYPALLENIKTNPQPYDTDKVHRICAQLRAVSPAASRPTLSDEERDWLDAAFGYDRSTTDLFVFEARSWVTAMKGNNLSPLYQKLLYDMADLDTLKDASSDIVAIHWSKDDYIGIAYHFRPELNCLLLLAPLRDHSDNSLIDHYTPLLSDPEDPIALSRISLRSYPLLMVLERDAWLAIQEDEESNLALSPEEAQIISSVRNTGTNSDLAYPLFINGLAGSGKSTILQYFAFNYLDFALRKETQRLPLYLTASEDLLSRARGNVKRLLTTNYTTILDANIDPSAVERVMAGSFWTFRGFFLSILPSELRSSFRSDRYVNYAVFRLLWETKFAMRREARQLSVEVSWHVIRSLIKGIRSHWEEELGPEDFEELPRRRRSVSSETFNSVYSDVWRAWYKPMCDEDGYWDDQDLSAYVLGTGVAREQQRAAIFCDEAQDFTSADLDVVFQLSLYSGRSMLAHELRRVPFIFAGDPLQTINPTGFRWDAVKADFHERFRATIEAGRRSSIEINDRDLRFNYRSNAGIVRFCNLIQLARAALLGRFDIRPQDYWAIEDPVSATWFAIDDPATKSHLRDHPELIKLVDCHEGEETDYVEKDPILQGIVDRSEEGTYRNIMCPARVKGLEFMGVVLYRFGEHAARDFERLLSGNVDLDDPQVQLPWEYFFNRLYVAASRSRSRLIVVDSKDAIERFWKVATDPEVHDYLVSRIHNRDIWEGTFAPLLRGTPEAWAGESVDQRAQADRFAAQGLRERDPYLLRQAGLSFRSVDEDYKARKCFAQAIEMEEKWNTAGDRYREIRLHDDAFRCYWRGESWQSLRTLAVQPDVQPEYVRRIESRAADFIASGNAPSRPFLDQLHSAVNDEAKFLAMSNDTTWHKVLGETADRLARTADYSISSMVDESGMFDRLLKSGVSLNTSSLATISFRAKNFRKAVQLWQDTNQILHNEYKRAKASITPFPDCLPLFKQLGDNAEIVRRWADQYQSDAAIRALEPHVVHTVVDAALDQGDLALAVTLIELHPERDRLGKLLAAGAKAKDDRIVYESAIVTSRLFVQSRAWKEVVDVETLVSIGELAGTPTTEIGASLNRLGKSNVLLETVIWELARSDALASDRPSLIASFLHRCFIGKNAAQNSKVRDFDFPVSVIGSAIERSGRIVDALQYYEDLLEETGSTQATKGFAAERLVRNLERHTLYLERRGNLQQAKQQTGRAERIRQKWGIEASELDDYPQVKKPNEVIGEADEVARSESYHSFWDSPTLEELARSHNVEPVSDVEDLFGTWPGEESDGFEEEIDILRHSESGQAP